MTFLLGILFKCTTYLAMGAMLIGNLFLPPAAAFEPLDAQALTCNFTVLADVHMESNNLDRYTGLNKGMRDIRGGTAPSDALVLLGDNTMNGQVIEYLLLYLQLAVYSRAKNTVVAMGNHDINPSVINSIDTAVERHNLFYNAYTGSKNDKPYYYKIINGYYFIVLGDELGYEDTTALISPEQLAWLADTMALAAADGKPVFVFCHQPFNDKFFRPVGGLGAQSDAVWDIVNAYKNVFFFSGHLHAPVTYFGAVQNGNVWLVDLPTFLSDENNMGLGYQIEVYPNRVALRARNYIEGEWLQTNQYVVPLV